MDSMPDLPLRPAGLGDAPSTDALTAGDDMVWVAGYNAARRDIAEWLRVQVAEHERDDDLAYAADQLLGREPPSIVFEVPQVHWPAEGTLTLVLDPGVREGQAIRLTEGVDDATVYRVTKVVPPDDDDPDPRWTVSVVEWQA